MQQTSLTRCCLSMLANFPAPGAPKNQFPGWNKPVSNAVVWAKLNAKATGSCSANEIKTKKLLEMNDWRFNLIVNGSLRLPAEIAWKALKALMADRCISNAYHQETHPVMRWTNDWNLKILTIIRGENWFCFAIVEWRWWVGSPGFHSPSRHNHWIMDIDFI